MNDKLEPKPLVQAFKPYDTLREAMTAAIAAGPKFVVALIPGGKWIVEEDTTKEPNAVLHLN